MGNKSHAAAGAKGNDRIYPACLPRTVNIKKELEQLSEPEYREFAYSLIRRSDCPDGETGFEGQPPMWGVRLPALRSLAKRMAKEDWKGYLYDLSDDSFEEILLQGLIIGYVPVKEEAVLNQIFPEIRKFTEKICNWSLCDSFCVTLKAARKYPEQFFEFISPFLYSEKEFEVRFGIVMLLDYYIEEIYLKELFEIFEKINHPGYYVKMAAAWAVSICYVKFPEETGEWMKRCRMDEFTFRKAVQKIGESRAVSREEKEYARALLADKFKK